jgi:hypothetical protein
MNRAMLRWLVLAGIVAAAATYLAMRAEVMTARERAEALQSVVTETESSLLGYTSYTKYLAEGKRRLTGQSKLLAATVGRNTTVTQVIDTAVLGLHSTGTVAISYTVEFAYGYDLAAEHYDIRAIDSGIEIRIGKPRLVATPAVTNLEYKVLSGGLLTDEKAAALRMFAQAAKLSQIRGRQLASEPAIVALCEKQLAQFLRDFLRKQPDVKIVPEIRIVYG